MEPLCKMTPAGRDFMGNLRETKCGRICQAWSAQKPNVHNFTANSLFPDGSATAAENKCRNPDANFVNGPWCFTNDPTVPRAECSVPLCPRECCSAVTFYLFFQVYGKWSLYS